MEVESPPSPQSTILVVDDTPENLQILGDALRGEFRVRVATDGPKALRIVESDDPPDLILLDVMMPEMDGFEVCRRIKANPARHEIPIIFVTALGGYDDERLGLNIGAIDYVTKPFSPAIVRARVRNHIELVRARKALQQHAETLERKVAERTADLKRALDELKESYLETIDFAYGVMNRADEFLGSHSKRVAYYAAQVAERLGLDHHSTFEIRVAALLHDIALVGVGEDELRRLFLLPHPNAQADRGYWAHAQAHVNVLSTSPHFAQAARLIARHHENVDGSGFPGGVSGDAIPLGSSLIAVADRWDVFMQVEPVARGTARTVEEFAARWHGKIDARVLEAFVQVIREGDPFSRVVERKVEELEAGMVLAQAVRTDKGVTLLSAGTAVRRDHLPDLARYVQSGELKNALKVYRKGA